MNMLEPVPVNQCHRISNHNSYCSSLWIVSLPLRRKKKPGQQIFRMADGNLKEKQYGIWLKNSLAASRKTVLSMSTWWLYSNDMANQSFVQNGHKHRLLPHFTWTCWSSQFLLPSAHGIQLAYSWSAEPQIKLQFALTSKWRHLSKLASVFPLLHEPGFKSSPERCYIGSIQLHQQFKQRLQLLRVYKWKFCFLQSEVSKCL